MTTAPPAAEWKLDRNGQRVFIGLMLGMFVSSISQTIVGPAMPRIVAELGGMSHYSWLATASMLTMAVSVPIIGKLSDLYGRRPFYIGGLIVFMAGSIISGFSQSFWMLVFGRAVQGLGMGALMPLSQTIIGDIVPPRQRGKYQGLMGAVFGVTSVAGPLAGGFITDHWGWRWLFFVSLPVGLVAVFFMTRFLHLEHTPRKVSIDFAGIGLLTVSLVSLLLATSLGGTSYAWDSTLILTLFTVGAVLMLVFLWVETKVEEPVIPLRLFRSSIFTFANIANFAVAILMFGAIFYIPVFAQGVLGVDATNSGLILMPLMLGMIVLGIVAGMLVTRTGRYKELMVIGVVFMGVGYWMLTRLDHTSTSTDLTLAMVMLGIGLGLAMQQYLLVVQNNATRADLGVATAASQFFRSVGSTVGVAIFGTVMTTNLGSHIASHLPPGAAAAGGQLNAGSVLDPAALAKLPPVVADAVRQGLAESLHQTFMVGLPVVVLALIATLLIKVIPLRDTVHSAEDSGREIVDSLGQSAVNSGELVPALGRDSEHVRTQERIIGLQLGLLARSATRPDRPLLAKAVTDLGDGDLDRGVALLERTARMLATEDDAAAAAAEKFAAEVAAKGERAGGVLSAELRQDLAALAANADRDTVLRSVEPAVTQRYESVDISTLSQVGSDLASAMLVDIEQSRLATSVSDRA